jgi:hypothetical protein
MVPHVRENRTARCVNRVLSARSETTAYLVTANQFADPCIGGLLAHGD